jgi:phosphoglycolate phosphatase
MTGPGGHPPTRAVIFDLDGTLVQTRVASWLIFEQINDRFDLGVTGPEQYFDLFRGNLFVQLRALCRDDAHADEVEAAFLDLLRREYTPPMIPGMVEVVRRLAGHCTLAVLSSNAMQVLRRILVDNDLAYCFAHVFGGDVAPDKTVAIEAFLAEPGSGFGRRCAADYDEGGAVAVPGPESTVLVTDTAGDVRAARAAGIRVIGVAWGMHSPAELTDAGAEFVALWPQEVASHLLGDAAAEEPQGACALPSAPAGATTAIGPGCGCGCTPGSPPTGSGSTETTALDAGRRRRDRRRAAVNAGSPVNAVGGAVAPSRSDGEAEAELLAALRRTCRRA